MKRKILILLSLSVALLSTAQDFIETEDLVLDASEDTTKVTTIGDIVNVQELVSTRNSNAAHYEKVWSHSSYFDIAYNDHTKFTPKGRIPLGIDYNGGYAPEFTSDYGGSLVLGHNYGLHKPIAGIAKFNIDYSYIDLNFNHFKAESETQKVYNSAATYTDPDDSRKEYQYIPWCFEKFEADYGMSLGASLTVAPFTVLKVPQLHFFKFNFFYHVGYHVSFLMARYNGDIDAGYSKEDNTREVNNMNWGHGITKSFGCRLSWKAIGVGYEVRTGELKYANFQPNDFGKDHYKFDTKTSRIFLEIRY